MNDQERDERIVEMHTDLKWLKSIWTEHIKSHKTISYLIYAALVTAFVGLVI